MQKLMQTNFIGWRHGDISGHPIDKLPDNVTKDERADANVLAYGEATGHRHVMVLDRPNKVEFYTDAEGRQYIKVNEPTSLVHEEHKELVVETGIYIKEIEREFSPFDEIINSVRD